MHACRSTLEDPTYADGRGAEEEAPLDEHLEVGLFTEAPGRGPFEARHVLLRERRPVRSGRQVLTFVTETRPAFAGVDPYGFYIDRERWDNVAAVD